MRIAAAAAKYEPEPAADPAASLIARIADGDRDALAALYDDWAPLLLGVARRILRDDREAEDLTHDVFLELWRRAGDYDPSRGTVRAWLMTRLRSRALDRLKAPSSARVVALRPADLEHAQSGGGGGAGIEADATRVRSALWGLTPEHRCLLELRYYEGLSSSQIATRVRLPIGTVKSRVAAALTRLRVALR